MKYFFPDGSALTLDELRTQVAAGTLDADAAYAMIRALNQVNPVFLNTVLSDSSYDVFKAANPDIAAMVDRTAVIASRLQQFVHQEEGGAIDGPVLGTVDKAEVIKRLTAIVVGMRLNLFFQKPGVACFFPVYVNMG